MNNQSAQYLTFRLHQEVLALGIAPIREIIESPQLTPIPLTPSFLRGVMNVRGAVVPVIDLALRLGRERTELGRRSCVVIVEVECGDGTPLDIGLLVDAVNEVLEVDAADTRPRPAFGLGIRADFVQAMIRREQELMVILEPAAVLSGSELDQLAKVGSAGEQSAA